MISNINNKRTILHFDLFQIIKKKFILFHLFLILSLFPFFVNLFSCLNKKTIFLSYIFPLFLSHILLYLLSLRISFIASIYQIKSFAYKKEWLLKIKIAKGKKIEFKNTYLQFISFHYNHNISFFHFQRHLIQSFEIPKKENILFMNQLFNI